MQIKPVSFLAAALALPLAIAPALAQAAAPEAPAVTAVRLLPGETIRLDGTLSHPAWQRAPVFSAFVEKDPQLGRAPSHETRVQVLFDEHAVYVGFTAFDPRPDEIRAPLVRHDGINRTQDFVVVYLDPIGSKRSAQFFRVNAAGSTADGMHTAADDSEDFSPDFDFDAAAHRNAHGYTAVLRIPFASLRFAEGVDGGWRIMAGRRVPRDRLYLYTSTLVPNDAPSFIATLNPLKEVARPAQHHFLTIRPTLTVRTERDRPAGAPATRDTDVLPSLDVKWRPTAQVVVDGTIKPDFSQVDLDVPQLGGNNRYALFFAEKRPFFFEASDLLRSPTEAMYTRSFTAPRWGVRATWRGNVHAGTAIAVDDQGGGLTLLPGTYGTGYAEQPSSRVLAARQVSNFGMVQAGGLVALRRYADGRGDNAVAGPDIAWQVGPQLRVRAQWLHSHTTALPDATGALRKGAAIDGDRVYVKAVHQTDTTQADVTIDDIGSGFRHDSGFVNQNGTRFVKLHYGHGWRHWGPFNEFWINLLGDNKSDRRTGKTIGGTIFPGIWLSAAHNTEFEFEIHPQGRTRASPTSPLMHEKFIWTRFSTTPATWIPQLESTLLVGRIADVVADAVRRGAQGDVMLRMRPHRRFEFEPKLSFAMLYRDGGLTYRETALALKGIWFFDARSNLRMLVQRTSLDRRAEPRVDAARDTGTVTSLTYTLRQSAGTVLYVGASHASAGIGAKSKGSEAFVKLQADVDEVRRLF